MGKQIVYYSIIVSTILGDKNDEAIIEIIPHGNSYYVSASGAKNIKARGDSKWIDSNGNPRIYQFVEDAKKDLEESWGPLQWHQKEILE